MIVKSVQVRRLPGMSFTGLDIQQDPNNPLGVVVKAGQITLTDGMQLVLGTDTAEAEIVRRIYAEYLAGNGSFKIAKLLDAEGIPTLTGSKWNESSILDILKNEKYKGDVILQKTYTPNHLTKLKKRNKGEVDSFYIKDNHPPIVSRKVWEQVQLEMKRRAEAKGNSKGLSKYQNRYPLTGMLFCSRCGATLRRRTWNSNNPCRKIV